MEDDFGESKILLETIWHWDAVKDSKDESVLVIDAHPDKPWILFTPSGSNVLQMWNYEDGKQVGSWRMPDGRSPDKVKFIVQKDWIVVQSMDCFKVYEFAVGKRLRHIEEWRSPTRRDNSPLALTVDRRSTHVLTGFRDGRVLLWDWGRKQGRIKTFKGHDEPVTCLAFHPRLSIFASAAGDVSIRVWNMEAHPISQSFCLYSHCGGPVHSMEFHSGLETTVLMTGHHGSTVKIWNYKKQRCVVELEGNNEESVSTFFHPHSPYVFSASKKGKVTIWRKSESNFELMAIAIHTGLSGQLYSMVPCRNFNEIIIGGNGEFKVLKVVAIRQDDAASVPALPGLEKEKEPVTAAAVTENTEAQLLPGL
ncbi:hypothetical protein CBR_g38689 [Chara braunii]|uniref:Uncharacterized protein n=1 Tax=Chara braunii TaxID=69332 RepID=A0A388LQ13_CHABU|nr:hypothetical protein CBR_g38689 [Chara braunii]|eukprot:GBG84407.1 hypothetical protein CBR_g38689 [Chara braunii]